MKPFADVVAFVQREWPAISKDLQADNVIFVRRRRVMLLGHEYACDMARLLGIYPPTVDRMRRNGNTYGQWMIVIGDDDKPGAFVIKNPRERRPEIKEIARHVQA